jgi:hypothetical protein
MNANADLDPLETAEFLHALTPVQAHNCIQLPPDLGNRPADPSQRERAYAPDSLTAATSASTTSRMHRLTSAATAGFKGTPHLTLPLTRASPAGLAPSRLEDTAMPF